MNQLPNWIESSLVYYDNKPCGCGSGQERYELVDARGISCGIVCEVCVVKRAEGFRQEIFTNAAYQCDEPIEEE